MSSIRTTAERLAKSTLDPWEVIPEYVSAVADKIEQALRDELQFAINLIETEIPVGGGKPFPLETVQPHVKAVLRLLRERAGVEP